MNNSPINSTINSTTVVELADASSLNLSVDSKDLWLKNEKKRQETQMFYIEPLIILTPLHTYV